MHIRRVVLNNIKGFTFADLDFCPDGHAYPGWVVITGDNGSGKTALLRAVALAILGPGQSRGLIQDLRGWVTEGEDAGTISVEIRPDHLYDKTLKGGYPIQGTFWAEIEITRDEGGTWEVRPTDIYRKKRKSAVNGPWSQSTEGWCALAYGPFRRLYGSSPDAQRLMVLPGRIPRFATLFKEDATLAECEIWVKELNYKKLEGSQPDASAALESLLELVGRDFLRHGVKVDKVDSEGIWLLDTASRKVPLEDMSEGYRSALAMLIDIFRHMVTIYGPDIVAADDKGRASVSRPGVVLIDEIDAHLHPGWQRDVGFWLQEHFPKVQFIVTTHSPLVCPAATDGRVYHLPASGDHEPEAFRLQRGDFERVIAGKPDQILVSPAFGLEHTRSPRAVRARERHARLVSRRLSSGGLSVDEARELEQLELFARD